MHAGGLRALEFDRIVEAVCRYALTPHGLRRLAALEPLTDPHAVAASLAATAETSRFLGDSHIGFHAGTDLDAILDSIGVEGRALDALHLIALSAFLSSVEGTCAAIRRAGASVPTLRRIADQAASFEAEIGDVRRKIDPAGEVLDDASPELKSIRERLRKQRTRLRGTLESYLRGKDTSKYLQQQIVTDRNGRYVLVVRSEHRAAIPGIVHGSSGSGASLFLEPLSTVEINNDIVALEQQEAEEVRRILLGLTDSFRRRGADLGHTVDAATELDVLQARAQLSRLVDGVEPAVATDGRLELRAARHPLLIPSVRRHITQGLSESDADSRAVVPVDVVLIPPVNVLVITGPNTGGKTVALKTAGLLSLMAQAGLLIPVAGGSQIPVYRSVFADIGDEQSISASLSTFSGHIANVVSMDKALDAAVAGSAGRGWRRYGSPRRRRAGDGDHRSLPAAGRHGDRDHALRCAEVLRVDDRRRHGSRLWLRSADVCPHVSPELRLTGQQPGARDCQSARDAGGRDRAGACTSHGTRIATRRTPGEG